MYRFKRELILPVFLATQWTTYELARRAGVGFRAAFNAVNGKRVGADIIAKVAAALGIDPMEFIEPAA